MADGVVRPRMLVPHDQRGRTTAEIRAPGAVNRSAGSLPGRSWPGSWLARRHAGSLYFLKSRDSCPISRAS